jgi:F0F1-type ATP synthase membrane subunit c/vacuolar-type H+-ATPase subunit K
MTTVLFFAALLVLGIGIYKAFSQVAAHVRRNPEAGKALFDHVFMPLFEERKAPNASEPTTNPD